MITKTTKTVGSSLYITNLPELSTGIIKRFFEFDGPIVKVSAIDGIVTYDNEKMTRYHFFADWTGIAKYMDGLFAKRSDSKRIFKHLCNLKHMRYSDYKREGITRVMSVSDTTWSLTTWDNHVLRELNSIISSSKISEIINCIISIKRGKVEPKAYVSHGCMF